FAQDHDGFLWFGTENGLVRFDGLEFKVFNEQKPPAIPHNFVSSLLVARDGSLWAGTRTGGLTRYLNDEFILPVPELSEEKVEAIVQTADDAIWLATAAGLKRIKGQTVTTFSRTNGLPDERITALAAAKDGSLWIGARNGTLCRYFEDRFTEIKDEQMKRSSSVKALAEDPASGDLWVAHDGDGLFHLRGNRLTRIDVLPDYHIENLQALSFDNEGQLWIGTQHHGIARYKDGIFSRFDVPDGLPTADVLALFLDKEGSMWAGTLFGGLNRLHRGKVATFSQREGLFAETISCVLDDGDGGLWLGTRLHGLLSYRNGVFLSVELAKDFSPDIRALLLDKRANLWVGAKDGGIAQRLSNGRVVSIENSGSATLSDITVFFEDSAGQIWIGSKRDGIRVYDPLEGKVTRVYDQQFFRTHIRCFAEAADGTVWIGTQNGLVELKEGRFTPRFVAEFPDASIRSILIEAGADLWIGTRDNGLLHLSGNRVVQFNSSTGLIHNRIYHLLRNGSDLWIAGNRGIERVSFHELEAFEAGKVPRISSEILTERDGLRTGECSGDSTPSAAVARDGTLWFGTRRGLAVVDPGQPATAAKFPKVFITGVILDSTPVNPKSIQRLPAKTVRVQIDYAAPALRDAAKVTYRYRLSGVDKEWVNAGRLREAVYYNLKPGKYQFEVAATCSDAASPA
ncbi:MAG TPA: two-component regulator propeller domain-containing protein, partial [Verrucomicrobiae bacterium]|nr:two-component regulator propeller domain-containing protein [Verrucomicrobiae bacterium]